MKTVVLVDDDEITNIFNEIIVKRNAEKANIIVISDAREAIRFVKSQTEISSPDKLIVLLDINMPHMTGWEVLEELDKLEPDRKELLYVNMLSASENADDIAKAKQFDMVKGYLTKPLTDEQMDDFVNEFVEFMAKANQ